MSIIVLRNEAPLLLTSSYMIRELFTTIKERTIDIDMIWNEFPEGQLYSTSLIEDGIIYHNIDVDKKQLAQLYKITQLQSPHESSQEMFILCQLIEW
jgi:hypothetical protein